MTDILELGKRAQAAAPAIAAAAPAVKNAALAAIADALIARTGEIVKKNQEDIERAVANGMSQRDIHIGDDCTAFPSCHGADRNHLLRQFPGILHSLHKCTASGLYIKNY